MKPLFIDDHYELAFFLMRGVKPDADGQYAVEINGRKKAMFRFEGTEANYRLHQAFYADAVLQEYTRNCGKAWRLIQEVKEGQGT